MTRAMQRVGAELYVELQQFYARQMPLLEARRFPEFLATFTEDGSVEHQPNGWKLEGRAQILTEMQARRGEASQPLVGEISPRDAREGNVPYYNGIVYRYWFDRMSVEPVGDELRVGYLAVMSMTDAKGKVSFEPTTTVQDVLVRVDGELYTRSRVVTHDSPNWADKIHNPS